ncbi:MAG: glycoside hydrolase family 31 protein [Cytophagales bacterium]|nr:glycoside hydrolase family 31 protein [Cytophagales bacterium]
MNPILNSSSSQSLGVLTAVTKTPSGISGTTSNGNFKVDLYNESIFKISISKEPFEAFSYAVVGTPESTAFNVVETESILTLITASTQLVVSKHPVRFSLQTLDGKVINEDDTFGTAWNGEQVTTYKKLQPGERFIGLGEKTGGLDRKGHAFQNWNSDAYGYHSGSDPLYCSTPFYIGIHQHLVYGLFFDNSYKSFFNFGASNNRFASFSADAGEMTYYLIHAATVAEIIKHYTFLTGRMELPPVWSIGYQQCRYSYYPDQEVLTLAKTFRDKDIPADVIVFDIHYMDKYKIFTWDPKNFPNPKALIAHLNQQGFHVVVMCDPGIKVEPGYKTYEDGLAQDVFIKYPDGQNYEGQVWPGWCHFPDFTKPETRAWWAEQFKDYVALGVDGFWNDMNEIATWGHSLPENLEFDFEGTKATTRRGRNLYGFQMARSTYEGTKALLKGKRPFNLTRSGFSGVQRYAAVWTGDNVSYDEHMLLGVRLVNSMGLTGIAFAGYDAGGFVGDANTKLFARWISIAALSPFFRAHTMINTRDSEPWSYGEEVENICRNYIKFRYQLMPYIYSLFYDASKTGMPVQRSLAINYTHDPLVYSGLYQNQYLFGPAILVAPVESNKELLKIYFPEGTWYDLYTGKQWQGNQEAIIESPIHKLPVFVKAGSVLPMRPAQAHAGIASTELALHIYCGNESTEFLLYSDDGETFQYQQGACATRLIQNHGSQNLVVVGKSEGAYTTTYTTLKIVLHGSNASQATINGKSFSLNQSRHSFFSPLEKYDPINEPDSMGEESVRWTEIDYTPDRLEIRW